MLTTTSILMLILVSTAEICSRENTIPPIIANSSKCILICLLLFNINYLVPPGVSHLLKLKETSVAYRYCLLGQAKLIHSYPS